MLEALVHVIMVEHHTVMVVKQYKIFFQYVIEITMLQNTLEYPDQVNHRLEIYIKTQTKLFNIDIFFQFTYDDQYDIF